MTRATQAPMKRSLFIRSAGRSYMRGSSSSVWFRGTFKLMLGGIFGLLAVVLLPALHGSSLAQLPTVVTGGDVHVYASFPRTVGGISFDSADNLYAGNYNDNNPPNGPAAMWHIDPADSSVAACGGAVDDPDAVYVDRNGILGIPGDVLVGGVLALGDTSLPSRIARDRRS